MSKAEVAGTVLEGARGGRRDRGWGWTPAGVDLTEPDLLVVGDRAVQVREVVAWPSSLHPGWVADTLLLGESTVVLNVAPVPPDRVRKAVQHSLPSLQSTVREAQRRNVVDAERERQIQDALQLLDAIASGMVRHFDVQLSALYWSDTEDGARSAGRVAQRRARERGVELAALRHSQKPSYLGALPAGRPLMPGLLLDQQALAANFPFADENLLDDGGVLVGINERTGAPALWNRWRPDVQHLLVTADVGSGKSYTVKALTSQERVLGRPVLVLDPSAKREYRTFLLAMGGVYLDLEPSGADKINPFAIFPDGDGQRRGLLPEQVSGRPVSERIAAVKPILAALIGESLETGMFDAVTEAALQRAYREAGFGDSWAACFEAGKSAMGGVLWNPKGAWPVLSDVRALLANSEDEEGPRYARMLAPYCHGGSTDLLDGQTTVALNSPVVGLGVNELISVGGRFARAGYAAVVDFATQRFRSLPDREKLLVADECHNFLADAVMSRWLERQLREARKQGTAVTVISQGVGDFLGTPPGRAIFQNTAAKLYLHQPAADLEEAARVLGMDAAVLREAAHLPRGHAIFSVGARVLQVHVTAPQSLHPLFRADTHQEEAAPSVAGV